MDTGSHDEWTETAVWCSRPWRAPLCGGWPRRTQNPEHCGVLQPTQQDLERHASHVYTQTWIRWVWHYACSHFWLLILNYLDWSVFLSFVTARSKVMFHIQNGIWVVSHSASCLRARQMDERILMIAFEKRSPHSRCAVLCCDNGKVCQAVMCCCLIVIPSAPWAHWGERSRIGTHLAPQMFEQINPSHMVVSTCR